MYEMCVEYMYVVEYFESLLIYLNVYSYFQIPTSLQLLVMPFYLDLIICNIIYILQKYQVKENK